MQTPMLTGRRILLTRADDQMDALAAAVEAAGGIPIRFPCLAVQCLPDAIRRAAARLTEFDDLLFTSVNGVHCVAQTIGNVRAALQGKRVAAVGRSTAACLRDLGIEADIVPATTASQEGLVEAYHRHGLPRNLLFFRAEEGRDMLVRELQRQGARVEVIPTYRTICPQEDTTEVLALLRNRAIDAVLLGSSKAARHYLQRIGDHELAGRPLIVAISEQVAAAAGHEGLGVQIVAKTASFDAMLDALADFLATAKRP